jgi:phosphate transport system substrate-binding protein
MTATRRNLLTGTAMGVMVALASPASGQQVQSLTGAGATFPAPLYHSWAQQSHRMLGFRVNYQSIGSGAGINQITNRTVDFGASDAPLAADRLRSSDLIQVPTVLGSIVLAYNIPGVPTGQLRITPDILAGIYMGRIQMWNDPRIVAINPGVNLPRFAISPVYRADGSGTTWIFTNYLSRVSEEWRTTSGASTSVRWPAGVGARGNEGVSSTVSRQRGAIGYVESSFAVINNLPVAQLRNRDGVFVMPTKENVQAVASRAQFSPENGFVPDLLDQTGENSWPIVGATYLLIPRNQPDANVRKMTFDWVQWAFAHGDEQAVRLHYVPLPDEVKSALLAAIHSGLALP